MSTQRRSPRWSWRDQGSLRRVLTLGIVAGLTVLGLEATGTLAAWTDSVPVDGTTISTGTLAPPTNVTVTQACVPESTPVRRPGAGGYTSNVTAGTGTTLTVTRPSDAATGDVLLAAITWAGNHLNGSPAPTAPGWTLTVAAGDNALGQFVYTRVVQANEPLSYVWTGQSSNKVGSIVAYSGVDPVNPVNQFGAFIEPEKHQSTAPSITTTRGNAKLVAVFGLLNNVPQSVPAGMSSIWSSISTVNPNITQLGVDQDWPNPGPTGERTSTAPGARTIASIVALQPRAHPYVTTTWTRSSSAWATGQEFRRSSGGTVQRQATLDAATTSTGGATGGGGPLIPGTSYTVDVTATFQNWRSSTSAASFTARSCWPM